MNDNAWAGVLMITLAVLIAIGFLTVWVRDRVRSREQAADVERTDNEAPLGTPSWGDAAEGPRDTSRERRH